MIQGYYASIYFQKTKGLWTHLVRFLIFQENLQVQVPNQKSGSGLVKLRTAVLHISRLPGSSTKTLIN